MSMGRHLGGDDWGEKLLKPTYYTSRKIILKIKLSKFAQCTFKFYMFNILDKDPKPGLQKPGYLEHSGLRPR